MRIARIKVGDSKLQHIVMVKAVLNHTSGILMIDEVAEADRASSWMKGQRAAHEVSLPLDAFQPHFRLSLDSLQTPRFESSSTVTQAV